MNTLTKYSPLIVGLLIGPLLGYIIIDLEKPMKLVFTALIMLGLSYFTTLINNKISRGTISKYPLVFRSQRLAALQQKATIPDYLLHILIVLSALIIGYGFSWNQMIAIIAGILLWWPVESKLELNFEKKFLIDNLVEKKQQTPNKPQISSKEQALFNAINEQKKKDPMVGLKIGSKEVVQRLIARLKNEKGVHVESLLGIVGSLAGYSCHAAFREELIDTGKKGQQEVFMVVEGKDGRNYYFGDLPNNLLIEGQVSVWKLVAGMVQHLGGELPDIQSIFSTVSSTVGEESFGVPNLLEQHQLGDLPINYVKEMWNHLLPLFDEFCDSPIERPILLGLIAQQVIEMGKSTISPSTAATIIMECAIPMSKIGPEWLDKNA
ncbi:MAG: hypothetical protein ABW115_01780 [Candidatus Thiodiazotropha sp. 6PLUC6]